MGKVVANFFISLDGVVESPEQWHFPYFDEAMGAAVSAGTEKAEAFLMGRVLYEQWSAYWTANGDTNPFGSFINPIAKYVVSSTLTGADWQNTTVISGDVAGQVRDLKSRTTGEIAMSGSATTVRWLLSQGLLDELNLLVHPIAVGHGQRLFEDVGTLPLKLLSSDVFGTGVLHLRYSPAEVESAAQG